LGNCESWYLKSRGGTKAGRYLYNCNSLVTSFRFLRFRIFDTWILFTSQRIVCITECATHLELERTTVVCKDVISCRPQKQELE
jgi:hypothetical protein